MTRSITTNFVVGSKNPCKYRTAERVLKSYDCFGEVLVLSSQVDSGVAHQPRSLEDMRAGASNRAFHAHIPIFHYAIGFESGVFKLFSTLEARDEGWFDACYCVVRTPDKRELHGLSSAFPVPPEMMQRIHEGMEMADAVEALGWGTAAIKSGGGLVSLLTNGRVLREHQVEQALVNALCALEVPEYWR